MKWGALAGAALMVGAVPASALLSASAAGATSRSPQHFSAHLDGAHETPPHDTAAKGIGIVTLNREETAITASIRWSGLTANATAAHIHGPASPGVAAPVLFPFTGVQAATTGAVPAQTFAITPMQVAQLKAGLFYFNVHTANFPAGEIRGQIHLGALRTSHFTGLLTGRQETPPHDTPAIGLGVVTLSDDETTITANLLWAGLVANATAAHIHGPAKPGTAAPVVFPFTGVPSSRNGAVFNQTFSVTPSQVSDLKAGLFYFNVHSSTFPAGEIRGQIKLVPNVGGGSHHHR